MAAAPPGAGTEMAARQLVLDSAMLAFLALALALPIYAMVRTTRGDVWSFGKVDCQPLRLADLMVSCGMVALLTFLMIGSPSGGEVELTAVGIWSSILFWGTISVVVIFYLSVLRGIDVLSWFGLSRCGLRRVVVSAVLGLVVILPLMMLANALFTMLVLERHFPDLGVQEVVRLFVESDDPAIRLGLVVTAVIVAPLAEEILFRGFLYPAIKRFTDPAFAMICSALLFASVHGNLPALVPLAVLGIGFAAAYEKTGSLWVPILMHALFNLTSLVVMTLAPDLTGAEMDERQESPSSATLLPAEIMLPSGLPS